QRAQTTGASRREALNAALREGPQRGMLVMSKFLLPARRGERPPAFFLPAPGNRLVDGGQADHAAPSLARSSIASKALIGTRSNLPILMTGSSPRLTAS